MQERLKRPRLSFVTWPKPILILKELILISLTCKSKLVTQKESKSKFWIPIHYLKLLEMLKRSKIIIHHDSANS